MVFGSDIVGATATTYTTVAADAGKVLRVAATATNGSGSVTETSVGSAAIVGPPVSTSAPLVSGTQSEGWTLTASTGSWTGNPTSYSYQWSHCDAAGANCVAIPGATAPSYELGHLDAGSKVTVDVTAQNAAGSVAAPSPATSPIAPIPPLPSPSPGSCGLVVNVDLQWISAVKWICRDGVATLGIQPRNWAGFYETFSPCVPIVGYPYNSCGQNGYLYHGSGNFLSFMQSVWNAYGPDSAAGGGLEQFSVQGCGDGQPGTTMGTQPCLHREFNFGGFPEEQSRGDCGNQEHATDAGSCVSDPIQAASGRFRDRAVDVTLPGLGIPFVLERAYNSEDVNVGPFGRGWAFSYGIRLEFPANGTIVFVAEDGQRIGFDAPNVTDARYRSELLTAPNGYKVIRRDQSAYYFSSTGRLTSLVDRNGIGLTFTYGANGLSSITDGSGRTIDVTTNIDKLITHIELPDGRSVSYAYTDRQLTSVTDLRGETVGYEYTPEGWLKKRIDQNNHASYTNTYDVAGRVVMQTDALGEETTFAWDAATETLTSTDALGHEWQDIFAANRLVARVDPLGNRTEYGYDTNSNLTSVEDPRGNTTTATYDAHGNALTVTAPSPLSHQVSYTYDSMNNLLTSTDGLGHTTTYEYDTDGNLTEITGADPDGTGSALAPVTSVETDPLTGLLSAITDPRAKTTEVEYTANGQPDRITSPLENVTTLAYDTGGRLTAIVEPRGNTSGATPTEYDTTYTYDAAGSVLTATNPLGNTTTFVYDDAGNLTRRTDAKNHSTNYAYDAANRLVSVTAPDLSVTTYAYDDIGNLTSRTDAKSHTTQYTYDLAGRLQTVLTPSNGLWTYEYDANGNLTKVTDANGNATGTAGDGVTTHTYDVLDRLTDIDYSDATPDVQLTYDAAGKRTSMVDGAGTQNYSYDALGRLTEASRGLDVFAYSYDATDNVTSRTYPGGSVATYAYDDDGRLASVTKSGATTNYAYDPAGHLTETELPAANGYVETRAYDRAGRLTSLEHAKSGVALASASYAYDAVGNPTSMTTLAGVSTYDYDALDRLVDVCFATSCPGGSDPFIRYTYDSVGNRTTETRPTGVTTSTYDAGDQLVSTSGPGGTDAYDFDANGNQTEAGARTFAYDLAGRMSTTAESSVTTSYSYDGDGVRLSASEGSASTDFLWDVNFGLPQLALERDGSGTTLRSYLHGIGPISATTAGATSYLHRDLLGSVTNVTSATGAAQWTFAYEPFGGTRTTTQNDPAAPANLLRFAGEYADPTGLYHLRARQYDTANGRFTATDPLAPLMSRPYVSSYAYVDNLPTALIDPSGLGPIWPDKTGGKGCDGWRNELRCLTNYIVEEELGWEPGCARSTRCLLGSELLVLSNIVPGGRSARAVGKIYKVGGDKTPSGKPYVGRTIQPTPRSRGSRDGRDRSDAEIVDTYDPEDLASGRAAEQGAINREGGVDALDNKRNEVRPDDWEDLGIDP